jgi:hypothetical protein
MALETVRRAVVPQKSEDMRRQVLQQIRARIDKAKAAR